MLAAASPPEFRSKFGRIIAFLPISGEIPKFGGWWRLWIEDKIDCKTKSFLYVLQSDKDPRQYCGQSGKTVACRTLQHAGDIENGREKAVSHHFRETGSEKMQQGSGKETVWSLLLPDRVAKPSH